MSATMQVERPLARVPEVRTEPIIPTVPDHIPPDVAAEHADAATVVVGRRAPRVGVRVVDRGDGRPAWAARFLGFVACAVLAAVATASAASGGPSPASEVPAGPSAPAVAAPAAPDASGCAPGAPVVPGCEPLCPTPSLLHFPWEPCVPGDASSSR